MIYEYLRETYVKLSGAKEAPFAWETILPNIHYNQVQTTPIAVDRSLIELKLEDVASQARHLCDLDMKSPFTNELHKNQKHIMFQMPLWKPT